MGSSVSPARRIVVTSVVVATLGLVSLMGCSKTEPAANAPGSTAAAPGTSTSSTAATGTGTSIGTSTGTSAGTVTVKTFTFMPSPVTVKVGERVTWQNQDDILHEPTAGTPAAKTDAFKAVELDGKGSSASVTFRTPGTYQYFCAVHESMVGEIVVT